MYVKVGVSNRHIHLKQEDLEVLFGSEYELEILKELSQPKEFASTAEVTLKTSKAEINNVRILGPVRNYTQVEISRTDAFKLGLNPPIRTSGDLNGSSGIMIIGLRGSLNLKEGCIIADRHIHITKEKRLELGLNDVEEVSIKIEGIKGGILNHVKLKEADNFCFELHLDTDDANSHLINNGDIVEIIKSNV